MLGEVGAQEMHTAGATYDPTTQSKRRKGMKNEKREEVPDLVS